MPIEFFPTVFAPNPLAVSQDASARTRVSQSTTQFDGKILNADNPLIWDRKGTGTGAFAANKFNMSVTAGQYYIRQAKVFSNYLSGKSQQIEVTFDDFAPQANVVKRVGYFSSNAVAPYDANYDGFWIENDGTTITLKVVRAGTETLSVPITSWTGYSDLAEYQTLANWNNFTVVEFDFLWLGGAVLRMFIKTSQGFVLAHIFNHAGSAQDLMILSPNQPVRYEIRSTTGSGAFHTICSQVTTEGSINESGFNNSGSSLLTAGVPSQTVATVATKYAVCGVRKKSTHRDAPVRVSGAEMIVHTVNDLLRWEVILNPKLSAPLTWTAITNSSCEIGVSGAVTAISITASGGRVLRSGFLAQQQPVPDGILDLDFLSKPGCTIDNVMDEIVLCATPLTSAITLNGALNWQE